VSFFFFFFSLLFSFLSPLLITNQRLYIAQDFPKARERLEDIKRSGKGGSRPRERISRNKNQQEGECVVM